jgi:hypothetical protein
LVIVISSSFVLSARVNGFLADQAGMHSPVGSSVDPGPEPFSSRPKISFLCVVLIGRH